MLTCKSFESPIGEHLQIISISFICHVPETRLASVSVGYIIRPEHINNSHSLVKQVNLYNCNICKIYISYSKNVIELAITPVISYIHTFLIIEYKLILSNLASMGVWYIMMRF